LTFRRPSRDVRAHVDHEEVTMGGTELNPAQKLLAQRYH
jgi:hypothetical protein